MLHSNNSSRRKGETSLSDGRTITLKLGTLLTVIGILCGVVGGWLVRRDVQIVTQANVVSDISLLKLESERTNAYTRSLHLWAVRISIKNGWPEPPAPEEFLKQSDYMVPGLVPEARAQENP